MWGKLSLVGTCVGSCSSKGKVDTETVVMCVTPSLGCEAGCGVLPVEGTRAGHNTIFCSHTHSVTTRNLGLFVCRLLIYLILRLVVLPKSCSNVLSWQLKPHNPSLLKPSLYVLLDLVWYLFCKQHPCLLGLVMCLSYSV